MSPPPALPLPPIDPLAMLACPRSIHHCQWHCAASLLARSALRPTSPDRRLPAPHPCRWAAASKAVAPHAAPACARCATCLPAAAPAPQPPLPHPTPPSCRAHSSTSLALCCPVSSSPCHPPRFSAASPPHPWSLPVWPLCDAATQCLPPLLPLLPSVHYNTSCNRDVRCEETASRSG